MDAIAAATGVTKRTLYYHFESKDALVAAVLDHQHGLALVHIGDWNDGTAKSCCEFLAATFEQLERWAAKPRWLGSGFTRLAMELAELQGHPARLAARMHKSDIELWLASELRSRGASNSAELAQQVMLLIEGAMALTLIHGDRAYVSSAAAAAIRLARSGKA
jgi:AcrR family transcriptional regulator